jgi:hypothetical protein
MHIHGLPTNFNDGGLGASAGANRAAAAQRAAEMRKRLATGAQGLDGASSPEETLMIGQWTDSRHSQTQSADEYHSSAAGRVPDFG